jgi:excisionase family DNA binding protein
MPPDGGKRRRGKSKRSIILPETSPVGMIYTTDEVAQLLKASRRTVQHWIRTGRLKALRVGGEYRVEAEELRRFVGKITDEDRP